MPTYTLPQFNLLVDLWVTNLSPDAMSYVPTYTNVPAQRYIQRIIVGSYGIGFWTNGLFVSEWRMAYSGGPFDGANLVDIATLGYISLTSDNGVFWRIHDCEIRHHGFPNEYLAFIGTKCDATGFPFLSATATYAGYNATDTKQQLGPPGT